MGHLKATYVCKGGGGGGRNSTKPILKSSNAQGIARGRGEVKALNLLTHSYIDFIQLSKLSGQVLPLARAYSICCGIKQQVE